MAESGISLGGLGLIAAGAVLAYSGVNDPVGGPVGVVRDILQGKTPTPGVQVGTAPVGPLGSLSGAIGNAISGIGTGGTGTGEQGILGGLGGAIGNSLSRSRILAVAQGYLGVPYRFGGASRSGMDCSGLVLVAYRDGAGITLPHLATAQAARGRRIDLASALPGDLAAWGVPGNYPHIAIIVDKSTVIVAPTWGKSVMYQALWEKKVSGFGYPDIIRILP